MEPLRIVLNSFVDVNWFAPLIWQLSRQGNEFDVCLIKEDLRKPKRKKYFSALTERTLSYPFFTGRTIHIFNTGEDYHSFAKHFRGFLVSSSTTLMALKRRFAKPYGQRWIGASFFGEDNDISCVTELFFVGSSADSNGIERHRVRLPLPYFDVFNPSIYPHLSPFRFSYDATRFREIITIPYITDAHSTWYEESTAYIKNHLTDDTLFVVKYRKKDELLARMFERQQREFADYDNVMFVDSPYFDLTAELMRVSTKVFFTRKLTQFIKECLFSHCAVEVLHQDEQTHFYRDHLNLPAYDTIFDDVCANRRAARRRHIYESSNHAAEMLQDIATLSPQRHTRRFFSWYIPNIVPWSAYVAGSRLFRPRSIL